MVSKKEKEKIMLDTLLMQFRGIKIIAKTHFLILTKPCAMFVLTIFVQSIAIIIWNHKPISKNLFIHNSFLKTKKF